MQLTIEFDRETDGRHIAQVPELPGCLAYGATKEEADASVRALALHILADQVVRAERDARDIVSAARVLGIPGVEGMDPEDVFWATDDNLQQQIKRSRENPRPVSHDDLLRHYGPTTALLAALHRCRLSGDTISDEEMSERLGIDPLEEAKWRRVAEEEIARSRVRRVWLDDMRDAPAGWTRAYTAREAIALLEAGGVAELSLDHDLGDVATCGCGHDVCVWIEEAVATRAFEPPSISIHSANPVGRQRMARAIDSIERLRRARQP